MFFTSNSSSNESLTQWLTQVKICRHQNTFTSLERSEHGIRRKRTAAIYSKSALMTSRHLKNVTRNILYDRLLPRLNEHAMGGVQIDGLDLSYCICSDYLSSFLFGDSNGTNYLSHPYPAITVWRQHYENSMCHESFFVQELPILYKLVKRLGFDLLPGEYRESRKFLEEWMSDMVSSADRPADDSKRSGKRTRFTDQPTVYEVTKAAVEADSPHLRDETKRKEIASEMFDHICKFSSDIPGRPNL